MSDDPVFDAAVAVVLAHEGGFQNDPHDAGNWTGGAVGAGACRGTKYGISAALIPISKSPRSARPTPAPSIACLQRALNAQGCAIAEDGLLGPATIAAAQSVSADAALAALRDALAAHYRAIVARDPTRERFLAGWLARAYA